TPQRGSPDPTQTPLAHVALDVHALPSSHTPPSASFWHVAEQQSPLSVLPLSHCSGASTTPLPQVCAGARVGAESPRARRRIKTDVDEPSNRDREARESDQIGVP